MYVRMYEYKTWINVSVDEFGASVFNCINANLRWTEFVRVPRPDLTRLRPLSLLSKWGGVCWYQYVCFFFSFFKKKIWSCLFLWRPSRVWKCIVERACAVVVLFLCFLFFLSVVVAHLLSPPPPPHSSLLDSHLRSSSASCIAFKDDATWSHFRNNSVSVSSCLLFIPSFLKQFYALAFFNPLVCDPYQMFYQGAYQLVVHPESVMLQSFCLFVC